MVCPARKKWCRPGLAVLWAVSLTVLVADSAMGHTSLEQYIRQTFSISLGPENVDVIIELSFPPELSLGERRRMDADSNQAISAQERETYLKLLQERAETLLDLSVDGKSLALIPLQEPELDLQDAPGVEAHPHGLRLVFFARTPKEFKAGSVLRLKSGLWLDAPRMMSAATETAHGVRLRSTHAKGLMPPSKETALLPVSESQCLEWSPVSPTNGEK